MNRITLLIAIALNCAACLPEGAMLGSIPAKPANADLRPLTDSERLRIRRALLADVPVPDFAEFRWARFPKAPASVEYYCGQLNAQTQPGLWVGFRPFIATIESRNNEIRHASLIELSSDRINVEGVVARCRDHGLDPFAASEGENGVSGQGAKR